MKRILFLIVLALMLCNHSWAKHEKGGYVQYQYLGPVAGDSTKSNYKITVTVFYSCTVQGPRVLEVCVYDAVTLGTPIKTIDFSKENSEVSITKSTYSPCLSNPPTICYLYDTYTTTVTLSNDTNGYIIGAVTTVGNQSGHRIDGIVNIYDEGGCNCNGNANELQCYSSCGTELAMWAQIPGKINGVDYHTNSSPSFLFKDTAVICYGQYFEYQFTAQDNADKDSISYSFGSAQDGAIVTAPPFPTVRYASGYTSNTPLGNNVTINPATGLISGIAPTTTGEYIIDVYAKEWRAGVLLDSVKKELQIDVNDCSLLSAQLDSVYVNCDSFTLTFQNLSTASNVTNYIWTFGDTISNKDTITTPVATHTYTQAGDYTLTLYVSNSSTGCSNSTTANVKVYPGFTPKFGVKGSCYLTPFYFTDSTYAKYGVLDSWNWNFGDPSSASNTATTDTASHLYSQPDTMQVILQVASSVGCSGSDTMPVIVKNKPYVFLPFTDTLICSNDTLRLQAQTSAPSFTWSQSPSMLDLDTLNPRVIPQDTTIYTLTVTQNECVGTYYDTVNVLKFITVGFNPDTMHVCFTDSVMLSPLTNANNNIAPRFHWTELDGLNTLSNDSIQNPWSKPVNEKTIYRVFVNLGHCPDSSFVTVYASPYPKVNISGPIDTTICYGDSIKLRATSNAVYTVWTPSTGLSNDSILNPRVSPPATTAYTLTARDTFYCPTPISVSDTIYVVPQFALNAGNDTTLILGEPMQLNAYITDTSFSYPVTYNWTPTTYLTYPDSSSTELKALVEPANDYVKYTVTATTPQGCVANDSILVKFYSTPPDIFVPTAFAPTGNVAQNMILTPVPVGIAHFEYFRVFNRFGQLVFSTSQVGKGWDGTFKGTPADMGTYAWEAYGVDYLTHPISRKGTVVLIR